jgi:phage shock protein PspC (stress-responsive transcriptional regulator)
MSHPDRPEEPEPRDEQASEPIPDPPVGEGGPPPPRRLTRSSEDRMIGGVAGGLGRYFDVDPLLFRIAFVVLTFAGGAGVLAYLGLWLIAPSDGPADPEARSRALVVAGGVALVLVALPFLLPVFALAIPLLPIVLLVLVIVLLARGARGKGDGGAADVLARVALVLLLLVVGTAGFLAAAAGAALGGGAVIAGVVIALGVGLVAAAFMGGARWLIAPALVLAVPAGLVAASNLDISGGMGEEEYRPATVAELRDGYELGAGQLTVDLRDLELPNGRTAVKLRMGTGEVRVWVPEGVCVNSDVELGAGYAEVLDGDSGGVDVDWRQNATAPSGVPTLDLQADIGLGALDVDTGPGELDRHWGRFDRDFRIDDDDEPASAASRGCTVT